MSEIKRMTIKEFREFGYLQELNRKFLHPLGLALEVVVNDDGTESFGGVWDYRDEEEGILYDQSLINSEEFQKKYRRVYSEILNRIDGRSKLGFWIQPIHRNENT